MKKGLLTLATALGVATLSASALTPVEMAPGQNRLGGKIANKFKMELPGSLLNPNARPGQNAKSMKRAAGNLSMTWGWCSDPYNAFDVPADEIKIAMKFTGEDIASLAGNKISAVQFANPTTYDYTNPVKSATMWIARSLDGEHIWEKTQDLGTEGFEYSTFELGQEAIDITADMGEYYVGATYTVPDGDDVFGFVTDYSYPQVDCSAYLYSTLNGIDEETGEFVWGDEYSWSSVGEYVGNLNIQLVISGENLPTNLVGISEYGVPGAIFPGVEFPVEAVVMNLGANPLTDLAISLDIAGHETQTAVSDIVIGYDALGNEIKGEVPYNGFGIVRGNFVCDKTGVDIPYTLRISEINGEADNGYDQVIEGSLYCLSEGYPRNNVIEEATGTWCGYCVVGIAGMEYMRENYADKGFIGIAMHGGDAMNVMAEGKAYEFADFIESFPSSYLNRDFATQIYPSPDGLESAFMMAENVPSPVKIDATLRRQGESALYDLDVNCGFSISSEVENEFGIGYAVVADNVGPYRQTNYLSGSTQNDYGFGSKPDSFLTKFNDVALNNSKPLAIEGSLPAQVAPGEMYNFKTQVDMSGYEIQSADFRVVPMVIHIPTGKIMNAVQVFSSDVTGIGGVANSKDAVIAFGGKGCLNLRNTGSGVSVYTVDGRKVASNLRGGRYNLPAGVYLVNDGRHTAKVLVK